MGYTSQTGKMISTSAKHLLGLLEQQTPPNMAIKNFLKPILERSSYFGWYIWRYYFPLKLASRRHWVVSNCFCDKSQVTLDFAVWELLSNRRGITEIAKINYVDAHSCDTGINFDKDSVAMSDRTYLKDAVNSHLALGWSN